MNVSKAQFRKTLLSLAVAMAVTGCATTGEDKKIVAPYHNDAREGITSVEALIESQFADTSDLDKVELVDTFFVDPVPMVRETGDWLASIPFTIEMDGYSTPVSLREVLKAFSRQGVNITTDLPIDSYSYTGLNITDSNARDALKLILGNMGLDYVANDEMRSVRITVMPRQSYYLSLNNRSATYSSGGAGDLSGSEESGSGSGSSSSDSLYEDEGSMGIETENNFWESLEDELEGRCQLINPNQQSMILDEDIVEGGENTNEFIDLMGDAIVPGGTDAKLVNGLQGATETGSGMDAESIQICDFTMNPNTGTVTVQGPSWLQEDMAEYFERLNKLLNSRITLAAKIVLFSSSEEASRGLDLNAFAGELAKTGLAVQNNVLGGLTVEAGTRNMVNISATGAVSDSFIGGRIDGAQAFIGWLESQGTVSIENEPVITTVSGVPTTFRRTSPIVYFRYDQQTTPNEGGTVSVSVETTEVERKVGSIINVNPTYDLDRRLVRAQIGVNQRYLTGWQADNSYLAAGETLTAVPIRVPLIEEIVLNGELLLKDGETIIVGGQKFATATQQGDGVMGLKNNQVVGGLFGSSESSNEVLTFYIILTVDVDASPNTIEQQL